MGVMGLTTFINRTNGPGTRCLLRDVSLVVDGSSLAVQLYRSSAARRRSSFNGDYSIIEAAFYKFFQCLRRCGIECYVICDGGYDRRKIKTAIERLESRIRDACVINPKSLEIPDLMIFPLMLRDVFFYVMTILNVKFVICEQEADQEIAIVARYLNAPVLSFDSDFYIYDVSYIPLISIDLKSPVTLNDDGKPTLDCEICKPGDFAKRYKIKPDLLPLMSTLLGNDYVKRGTFLRFFKNLSLHSKKKKSTLGQNRIYSLIEWLQNEDFDSAVKKVLDRFKLHQRQRILSLIKKSCEAYKKTYCKSLYYLNIRKDTCNEYSDNDNNDFLNSEDDFENSLISPEQNSNNFIYPIWFLSLMRIGKISPRFFELLKYQMYISSPQVENKQSEDALTLSFPILRFSFDLITKFVYSKDLQYFGRQYKKVVKIPICTKIKIPKHLKAKLDDENISPSKDFFFYFLGKSISKPVLNYIEKVDRNIQILVLTIVWIKSQSSKLFLINESHIYCLLLYGIIFKNTLNSPKVSKISKEELKSAASAFSKYLQTDDKISSNLKLYDVKIVHEFAQFQCCLQQLSYLNVICSEPLVPCIISQTYNGTFLYNLYSQLIRKDEPSKYISNLLKDSPSIYDYVISHLNVINSIQPKKYNNLFRTICNFKYYFVLIILVVMLLFCLLKYM